MERLLSRLLAVFAVAVLVAPVGAWGEEDPEDGSNIKPAPGREVIAPVKPDWCDGATAWSASGIGAEAAGADVVQTIRGVAAEVRSGYGEKTVRRIAQAACSAPDDKKLQAAIAHFRQGYVNLIGQSEKDDRLAQKVRASATYEQDQKTWCDSLKPDEEASAEEKSLAEAWSAGTGCWWKGRTGSPLGVRADGMNKELGWWLDRRAEVPSEVLRAVFVTRCLRILKDDSASAPDPKQNEVLSAYATCGPDARRLDKARLEKELADPKFNDFARIHAREVFALAKSVGDFLGAELKKRGDKDPDVKKLVIDAPEAAFTAWEKTYAENKEALEAANDVEARYWKSRKSLAGCSDKVRKLWSAYLVSKKPKGLEEAFKAAYDEVGARLLGALVVCDAVDGRLQVAKTEAALLKGGSGDDEIKVYGAGAPLRRGPRVAAYHGALAVLSGIVAERERFPTKTFWLPLEPPEGDSPEEWAFGRWANKVAGEPDAKGTIAGVKKVEGGVEVSWKPVTTMIWNRICTRSNRIRGFKNGQIDYDYDCAMGKPDKVPVTTQIKPFTVPAEVAAGLAAGQTATFTVNMRDMPKRDGAPRDVWQAGKLKVFYGVTLP